jgi:hypothetical protein
MTFDMEKGLNATAMETVMKAISLMERPTVKVSITGQTERSMMANGAKESKKVMACGKAFLAIATWGSGVGRKHMVMESTCGKMGTDMKEAGIIA